MKKKLFLSMLAGMMALGTMAQSGEFTVKGTFEGLGDSVRLFIRDLGMEQLRAVTGEMQEVNFDLKDASLLEIMQWAGEGERGDRYVTVPAIPGEKLIVTKDEKNGEIQLSGSQFYVDYNEAQNWLEPSNKAVEIFIMHLREQLDAGTPQEQLMEEYQENMPKLTEAYVSALMEYVKAHPDQDAAAALIAELPDEVEDIEAAAALLTDRARNSMAANLYKKNLEKAQKEAEEEAKKYALEGCMAPDFTLNDINGNPLALNSLRGKWVIIDFWGSWCGWCIKGMPKMKEYYAKYNDKLEILGVDCNDTVEKWKAAVAKHELPWLHVYCDSEKGDNPVWYYGVQSFPTKIVVNPEGQVAKIVIGEDPKFYDYLDQVLQ
ncbi:MAG: TlpA family protein disulfide reductase [Muribaculaceae bacterium]|nr:TlpA family protein disulfide reductase [Muribaculaceae bacterium]